MLLHAATAIAGMLSTTRCRTITAIMEVMEKGDTEEIWLSHERAIMQE